MSDKQKPVSTIDLFPVEASIWRNEGTKGVFYNVTLTSRYKDANGKWQNSPSLSENELLLAAKALDMAHSETLRLRANDRATKRHEDEAA